MSTPTRSMRRFMAQQKAQAMELCLKEGLSCNAVAQRLGLPSSSLARWVRQARIDRGQAGPREQGLLTSKERAELNSKVSSVAARLVVGMVRLVEVVLEPEKRACPPLATSAAEPIA